MNSGGCCIIVSIHHWRLWLLILNSGMSCQLLQVEGCELTRSDEYLAAVEAIVSDPTGSMGDIGKDLFLVSAVPDLAHVCSRIPSSSADG